MRDKTTKSRIESFRMSSEEEKSTNNPKTADLSGLKIDRLKEEKIKRRRWPKFIPWILILALNHSLLSTLNKESTSFKLWKSLPIILANCFKPYIVFSSLSRKESKLLMYN